MFQTDPIFGDLSCREWGSVMSASKGRHFEGEIVLSPVRWCCQYGISNWHPELMMVRAT